MPSITILLVNVSATTACMDTARAHVNANPCPVETRPAGAMTEEATETVHRLEIKSPDTLLSNACGRYSQGNYAATGLSTIRMPSLW